MAAIVVIGTACAAAERTAGPTAVPGPVTARSPSRSSRNLDPAVPTAAFAAAADAGAGAAVLPRRRARRDRPWAQRRSVRPCRRPAPAYRWTLPTAADPALGRRARSASRDRPACSADGQVMISADVGEPARGAGRRRHRTCVGGQRRVASSSSARSLPDAERRRHRAGDVDRVGRRARLRAPDQRPDLRLPVRSQAVDRRARRRTGWSAPTSGSGRRWDPHRPRRARSAWPRPRPSSASSRTASPAAGSSASTRRGSRPTSSARPFAGIPIVATCNNAIMPGLQGALNEVAAAGLAGAIDVANTNTYGGCFGAAVGPADRRHDGRHPVAAHLGQALDTNTASNARAACRRWTAASCGSSASGASRGAATSSTPDGMHFEWVGERRRPDQLPVDATARTRWRPRPAPGRSPSCRRRRRRCRSRARAIARAPTAAATRPRD